MHIHILVFTFGYCHRLSLSLANKFPNDKLVFTLSPRILFVVGIFQFHREFWSSSHMFRYLHHLMFEWFECVLNCCCCCYCFIELHINLPLTIFRFLRRTLQAMPNRFPVRIVRSLDQPTMACGPKVHEYNLCNFRWKKINEN